MYQYVLENQSKIAEMIRYGLIPNEKIMVEKNIYHEYLKMDDKQPIMKRQERLAKDFGIGLSTLRNIIKKMEHKIQVM